MKTCNLLWFRCCQIIPLWAMENPMGFCNSPDTMAFISRLIPDTVSTTVFSLKSSETSVKNHHSRFGRVIFTPQMAPDRKPAKRFPSFRTSPVWSSRPNSCRSKREAWHRLPWSWMQNDAGEKRAAETMEGSILGGILRQFDGASLFKLFGEKHKCHMLGLFRAQEIVLRSKPHAFRPKTKPVILCCFDQAICH